MLSVITNGNDYEVYVELSQAKEYQMGGHLRREHYRLSCYREGTNYPRRSSRSNSTYRTEKYGSDETS